MDLTAARRIIKTCIITRHYWRLKNCWHCLTVSMLFSFNEYY